MNRIKQFLITVLYYHISLVVLICLLLGGIGAGVIIVLFEFRTPVPPDDSSQIISEQPIRVSKGVLDHISTYKDTKAEDSSHAPSIGSGIFYIPPKTQ